MIKCARITLLSSLVTLVFCASLAQAQSRTVVVSGLLAKFASDAAESDASTFEPIGGVQVFLATTESGRTKLAEDYTSQMGLFSLAADGIHPSVDRIWVYFTDGVHWRSAQVDLISEEGLRSTKLPIIYAVPEGLDDLSAEEAAFANNSAAETAARMSESGQLTPDESLELFENEYVQIMARMEQAGEADWDGLGAETLTRLGLQDPASLGRPELLAQIVEQRGWVVGTRQELNRFAAGEINELRPGTVEFLLNAPAIALSPEWVPVQRTSAKLRERATRDTSGISPESMFLIDFAEAGEEGIDFRFAVTGEQLQRSRVEPLGFAALHDKRLRRYLILDGVAELDSLEAAEPELSARVREQVRAVRVNVRERGG